MGQVREMPVLTDAFEPLINSPKAKEVPCVPSGGRAT